MEAVCFNVNYDDYDGVVQTTVKSLCVEGRVHVDHFTVVGEHMESKVYENFCPCDGTCKPTPFTLHQGAAAIVERVLLSGFESVKDEKLVESETPY